MSGEADFELRLGGIPGRMGVELVDWGDVNWLRSDEQIAVRLGVTPEAVAHHRQRHAPHTSWLHGEKRQRLTHAVRPRPVRPASDPASAQQRG